MSTVHVLANPASGGGSADVGEVEDAIRRAGHAVEPLRATSADGSAALAAAAVADGAQRLVVVGGDGLVRIAVGAVATTGTVLGIVPQGTGNDFARALGLLDGSLADQVARALAPPVPVDAMRTNHGWVASVATLGFSGDVTARANRLRWPRGAQRYTVATLLQLPRLRSVRATVQIEGTIHDASTSLLSVGNTRYFGGGMAICPDARPADGHAQVVVVGAVGRWRFLRVFPRAFSGGHLRDPEVTTYRVSSVTVDGDRGEMMWADGDELGPLPVTCEIVAGALAVAGAAP